uniref:Uncharacterized protein n=1 Tax=Chromera velia CCMP2878 TaxID=1169474 RepID=A0A0G4HYA3_9ALVE|eukprot:Cvel_33498.t1-p1 / transcript=Cvel_33498.t1 / gene=Cvel_33498 / organism=Chromera_velia_CCMP2878 / gene_product=hypothetical protein / transcript_product=hypothetical protein / location=Cvel_scaffold5457:1980-2369(-) / protein_length=130 / sequence_SO=supercontig / SO=protein_coding / is_pseudo=false
MFGVGPGSEAPLTLLRKQQDLVKEVFRDIRDCSDFPSMKRACSRWARTEDEQQKMIDCYARCLSLKALLKDDQADLLSMPCQIDSLWHEHVLETRKYTALMERLRQKHGCPFLHHSTEMADNQYARHERF